MLEQLRNTDEGQRVTFTNTFRKDLDWFRTFTQSINGCSTFKNWGARIHEAVYIDTSLHGLGAVRENQFYSTTLPPYILKENRIVVFEMIIILVSLNTSGKEWENKHIEVHCDNRVVVDIMERNKTMIID